MIIGNRNGYFDNPYPGYINELNLYNSALSAAEISFIANNVVLGFARNTTKPSALNIHPNPFDHQLIIELSELKTDNVQINIYDLTGKLVYNSVQKISSNSIYINDLDALPKGFYTCVVKADERNYAQKIIKK